MNECRHVHHLLALRDADRSPAEQALVTAHIQTCPECAAWARQCREQDALISSLPRVKPSPLQNRRFLAQIQIERKRHTMFTQLKTVANVALMVTFLLALVLVANFLMPKSLPDQDHLPASSAEVSGTPVVEASPTPVQTPSEPQWIITPAPTPNSEPESTWESPDGQWVVQVRTTQQDIPPEDAVCEEEGLQLGAKPAGDMHVTVDVQNRDGTVQWTVRDQWYCEMGYGVPTQFTWSQDGQRLYFSQRLAMGGDAPLFMNDSGIWRVDLADGQVTEVPVPDGYAHTISPDESRIAYMSRNEPPELVIYDIATRSEQRVAFWNLLFSEPQSLAEAGRLLWSPDGKWVFFAARNGRMPDAVEFAIARLDSSSLTVMPFIKDSDRFIWPQRIADGQLLVQDQDGRTWWIDAKTGVTTLSSCIEHYPVTLCSEKGEALERTVQCIEALPDHWWETDSPLVWESYAPDSEGAQLRISADGDVGIGGCDGVFFPMNQNYPNPRQWIGYDEWAFFEARFAPFEYETGQEKLVFVGKGQEVASPAWQRAIAEWARYVHSSFYTGQACASCPTEFYWKFEFPDPDQCAVLIVTKFGEVSLTPAWCELNSLFESALQPEGVLLPSDHWDRFDSWLQNSGTLRCYENGIEKAVFNGEGNRPLSDDEMSEFIDWAKNVYAWITADQQGWSDAQELNWTCNQAPSTEDVPEGGVTPLDVEALRNATYRASEYVSSYDTVQLADGVGKLPAWPDDPTMVPDVLFMESDIPFGDLNGDTIDDAIAILDFHAPGTTAHPRLLAIVINQDGKPYNLASVAIGDRTVIEGITIQSGEVTVNALVHALDDPLCCPSMGVTWKFKLEGDEIIWLSDDVPQSVQ